MEQDEQEVYAEGLFRVLALIPDVKLIELAGVLEQARDLSDEELKERLADIFAGQGEENG